jgi:lipopolysaccharide transport protein LptA
MLKTDQPVYATAASVDYDSDAGKAVYTGAAKLWQADTAIQGDRITMDDQTGNLAAHGSVRSAFPFEQLDEKTKKTSTAVTVGKGDDLVYDDATRRATYTGSAHVSGPQGDLRGDRIELFLSESGGQLERVEGYTKVTLKAEGRTATGDRMTYYAADQRYLMLGTPVTIVSECRESTGRALTLWRSTDRILIDGKEERRTETKGGAKCGEPR